MSGGEGLAQRNRRRQLGFDIHDLSYEDRWRSVKTHDKFVVWWFDINYAFCALQFLGVLSCHLSLFLNVPNCFQISVPSAPLHWHTQCTMGSLVASWIISCPRRQKLRGLVSLDIRHPASEVCEFFHFGLMKRQPSEPVQWASEVLQYSSWLQVTPQQSASFVAAAAMTQLPSCTPCILRALQGMYNFWSRTRSPGPRKARWEGLRGHSNSLWTEVFWFFAGLKVMRSSFFAYRGSLRLVSPPATSSTCASYTSFRTLFLICSAFP